MYHYEYEVSEDYELTVTWYNQDGEEIITGRKMIAPNANKIVAARLFANDLRYNNPELFPEPDPEPEVTAESMDDAEEAKNK